MDYVLLKNRASHNVGYSIIDKNIHRHFAPGEVKKLPMEEIKELAWSTGGLRTLQKYLIIQDAAAREEIFGTSEVEPEYLYTKEDVTKLLLKGTLDELDDCLTFGGPAVCDLVVEVAFETEISDINKRDLIFKKTGYDITMMIKNEKDSKVEGEEDVDAKPQRKAAKPAAPQRKADSSKPSWND